MKKLLTVFKSKYYMIKINYSKILKDVETEGYGKVSKEAE